VRRYRGYLIGLAIVAVLTGAYAAAGFLALPYFARRGAQDFVRTHYGRTLAMGDIRFNPFTLALDVRQLALPDADGQTLLAFARLHVQLQWATLWRFAPSFGEIILERPYVRAVLRPGGELNLADLGKGFAPPPAPTAPQAKSAPLRLYIQRFAVISGNTTFEDRTRPTPFHAEFTPIAFELRDFSTTTTTATGNAYTLNAASPEGERLIWSGTVRLTPLASHGEFEIADLKARTVWNYLRASLPFEIAAGVIGVRGDYDLVSGGAPLGLTLNVRSTRVSGLAVRPRGASQDYVSGSVEVDDARRCRLEECGHDVLARMRDDGNVGILKGLCRAVGEYPPEVRKLGLDVLTVGTDQGRGVDNGVVDADFVSLAEQRLRQVDVGALTQVVAVGLEAQPKEGDPTTLAGNDTVDGIFDREPIA